MGAKRTDSTEDVTGDLEFLTRSSNRVRLLEALTEMNRAEKDELQAAIEADRTTLTRNLDALEERGWIQVSNPACRITPAGRDIVNGLLGLEKTVEIGGRFREFFRWLPADEFDLNIRELAGADLFTPESSDPYAMINRHVKKIKESDYHCVLLPVVGLHGYEAGREQVVNDETKVELIMEANAAETIQTDPQYRQCTDDMAATDRFKVYEYDGVIPYGICLFDETVQILVNEGQEPRALLEVNSATVRDWAKETLEAYKADATQVI